VKNNLTVEEVKECKAEAERKILKILIDLHEDTGGVISDVAFTSEEMLRIGGNTTQTFSGISLRLEF
jgi:hypothetical protein